MRPRLRLAFLAILAVVGVIAVYWFAVPRFELYQLRHADPVADANHALVRGDHHLVAVQLLAVYVPVGDRELSPEEFSKCDVRSVSRRTSDLVDDLTRAFNGAARSYASAYNREVLRHGPCAPAPSLPPNPRLQRPGA